MTNHDINLRKALEEAVKLAKTGQEAIEIAELFLAWLEKDEKPKTSNR